MPATESRLVELPIGALVESKTNPRRHFDEGKLRELAQSAKEHGILEPLLVRPARGKDQEKHEIVAGARRFRAAKLAGLAVLPVRIIELTDEQALEIQVIENLQREDVHPLEEAEGYARLLQSEAYNADVLAEKVGKDRSYIYKRIQLLQLISKARTAYFDGKITYGHALHICRLPEDRQNEAFAYCFRPSWNGKKPDKAGITASELARWIREHVHRNLAGAPWQKSDPNLVPKAGPCTTCQKRTGANAELFDDMKKGDQCLDGKCFEAKRAAFVQVMIQTRPDLPRVTLDWGDRLSAGVIGRSNFLLIRTESDKCKHAEPALVATGTERVGHTVLICRSQECKKHGQYQSSDFGKPATVADKWADKKKRLDETIRVEARREAVRQIIAGDQGLGEHELHIIAEKLVTGYLRDDGRKELAHILRLPKTKHADLEKALLAAIPNDDSVQGLLLGLCAMHPYGNPRYLSGSILDKRILDGAGIDLGELQKSVGAPMLAKFEASKKRAAEKAAEDKKAAKRKEAAK